MDRILCAFRYWYNNGCLFPDLGTVFIAIDKCDVENGCLKVHCAACDSRISDLWSLGPRGCIGSEGLLRINYILGAEGFT